MNPDANPLKRVDRRTFLLASATAAVATLSACSTGGGNDEGGGREGGKGGTKNAAKDAAKSGRVSRKGSVTTPLKPPAKFAEAPDLAAQVKAGSLPAVAERLPDSPYVVPHRWVTPGKYGGNLRMPTTDPAGASNKEYMYGHSLLRWLNDGRDVGPGLVQEWDSNADASEWTFHFRKGLRWSDGKPWSTADIMFWWEDMVLNKDHSEAPPDETKGADGELVKMSAPDPHTLVLRFTTPAPLTPFHLARWVNGNVGPAWMAPKHYLAEYHPRYNPKVGADWAAAGGKFDRLRDYGTNPDCPTMNGWKVRSYREGRSAVWERNPYYWCVDTAGNQLPYLDTVTITAVQDVEVTKLQLQQGKLDHAHGPFLSLTLGDVSGLKQTQGRTGLEVLLWDGGSGTGSIFFFNYDYKDDKLRPLIREPKFRQALSYAFNRADARKAIYFNTGELTTGTYSPKAIDLQGSARARRAYAGWRDSYVRHDPKKAKAILDDLGVVDRDGDGLRELPDGGKLVVRLDYPAGTSPEHIHKNAMLERDWRAIGIAVKQNPVAPDAFSIRWQAGELMTTTAWENGGGIHEILVEPQVLIPLAGFADWWAPLHANYHAIRNTPEAAKVKNTDPYERKPPSVEPEKGGPIARLWELHDRAKVEPDALRRYRLVWEMVKIHVTDGPFFIGPVANTPVPILAHKDLRNVPRRENLALNGFAGPWSHPTPAVYDPETWHWTNPDRHT
ncbi:ABC transporter substrate-binding protein [Actinopolymorpha singaporensis]|uniref:Peptide/nickel transport system substrate-binding protein n=1 Tax=Actinopolymorpha singaporensis TaxID=117157 RepID=A0A1H1MAC2_9ACTN|nr:ABC transporter substrate-binding protein [Actinopolymorpha singaporensis]SDR83315.1 peptide/nickel transport system substrate-binding protein [Actinopolymorpha singaporensis]